MHESSIGIASEGRASERVVVDVHSPVARWVGALALLSAACWLMKVIARGPIDRLEWSLTVLAAVALIARGVFLGRPVTAGHAIGAVFLLLAGIGAHVLSLDLLGDLLIAGSGLALMSPTSARRHPGDLSRVWSLIETTSGDPLAPFAMQAGKCYLFSADGTAVLAYRTRIGYAVVSGDPVGDEARFPQLVADFAAMCHTHGWRIVVLACSERRGRLWAELTEVLRASSSGAHTDRGFCMNLDGALQGRYPGIQLIIARDKSGRVQGFHRYATAGGGSDVTLDVPWRRPGAPDGIDERLSIDMVNAAKDAGAQRVSLAFAAFPEIFDERQRGRMQALFYWLIHLLDPLIALESLYRYLRKFHAPDDRRYVLLSLTQIVPLICVLLSLEFMPRRRSV